MSALKMQRFSAGRDSRWLQTASHIPTGDANTLRHCHIHVLGIYYPRWCTLLTPSTTSRVYATIDMILQPPIINNSVLGSPWSRGFIWSSPCPVHGVVFYRALLIGPALHSRSPTFIKLCLLTRSRFPRRNKNNRYMHVSFTIGIRTTALPSTGALVYSINRGPR